ncbi:MAG: hypothetical protein P8L18_01680 [Verrucomicrobiota bacterium]|nr:hypothetical protein [Verrucomicrobiota bacterium]
MTRIFNKIAILSLLLVSAKAHAFSLAGPQPPWMLEAAPSSAACYGGPELLNISGPMAIDEEYRFNVPFVTYGVTADFASYFGKRGVDEIREAIELVNELPTLASLNPADYPTRGFRLNHRASALGLTDVKSVAVQNILHFLGLEDPTYWAYAPRNAWIQNGQVLAYYMTVRNFDPDSFQQSPYINGSLYTYNRQGCPYVFPTDPSDRFFARTMPVAARHNGDVQVPGLFVTGLTRDDVGGLRYLYHPKNYNAEPVLPDVADPSGAIAGAGGFGGGGGGGGIYDYAGTGGGFGGGIYDSAIIATNALATVTAGGAGGTTVGGGGVGAGTGNFASNAVRPGMGMINFVESHYDSLLGEFFTPLSINFRDTIVTNGTRRTQRLVRNITAPDIIFDAKDLQGAFGQDPPIVLRGAAGVTYINSDTIDNNQGDDDGPGIVQTGTFTFNTIGSLFVGVVNATGNFLENGQFSELSDAPIWGSFDGSTEDPIVYPQGTNLDDLESLVFSR